MLQLEEESQQQVEKDNKSFDPPVSRCILFSSLTQLIHNLNNIILKLILSKHRGNQTLNGSICITRKYVSQVCRVQDKITVTCPGSHSKSNSVILETIPAMVSPWSAL
jgi:hypothetical protein